MRITATGWDLVREKCEAPLMTVVYNINVHGVSPESCDRRHEVISAVLEACAFSLREISRASQQHEQLSVHFDGVARDLRHDARRLWRVHLALRCLPRMGGARPRVVRILTGHLVHNIISSARPLDRWRKFSRADLAELRTLAGVVWLSECELGRPLSLVVFCSDATLRRYCVQCTTASFKELKEATCFRERWRFRTREISRALPVRHADGIARLGALSILVTIQRNKMSLIQSHTLAELQTLKKCRLGTALGSTARACVPTELLDGLPVLKQCVAAIRRLPLAWCDPSRWHMIVEGNFKFREAIHVKEGRAALMGLRRSVAGTAVVHGHRFLILTDNMNRRLAFDRGRSCSYDLLFLCRRAAALCIGADVS